MQGLLTAQEPKTIDVWPKTPPGDADLKLDAEIDFAKKEITMVAGKPIIRLGNVSTPTLTVYKPPKEKDTGAAVVICPGGGYHILALDLEGTEVAEWLNSIGVTGIVLKYRVPARDPKQRWLAAVQDAQRSIRLARQHAKEWEIDPNRIGILGFSAGGDAACRASLLEPQYTAIDKTDELSSAPNFSVLIYPGYLANEKEGALQSDIKASSSTPPFFLVHALDDGVTSDSSTLLFAELKRNKVAAELHVYDRGGHGYGLRETDKPVTRWPKACEEWLKVGGWLKGN